MEPIQTEITKHQTIELDAYYLWHRRGCPFGEPEVDWFQAEEQLREQTDPALVAVAKTVGSALGSVAGLVGSMSGLLHSNQAS